MQENLDLTQAVDLAKTLAAARGADLAIDASEVQRVGTQCVQLLLAAVASWRSDGARLTVTRASDIFLEALRLLGLQSEFPIEEPSL